MFVHAIAADGDRSLIPEKSLRSALDKLPADDGSTRAYLQGLLGLVVARNGDWDVGLQLVIPSLTNSLCDIGLWYDATQLSGLIKNDQLRRSLFVSGLTRFAGGSDH